MKSDLTIQPSFNFSGETLAVAGMNLAVETAEKEFPGWKDRCWLIFYHWLNRKPQYHEFRIEEFREYAYKYDLIEKPKSERAYGFLSKKAVKQNLIQHAGTAKVTNVKAHATPVNVWYKK